MTITNSSKDLHSTSLPDSLKGTKKQGKYEKVDLAGSFLHTSDGTFELLERVKGGKEGTIYKGQNMDGSTIGDIVALKVYHSYEKGAAYLDHAKTYEKKYLINSPFVKKMRPPVEGLLNKENDKVIIQISSFSEGGDLSKICFLPKIHDLTSIRILFEQMAVGLRSLHDHGFLAHSDIKPGNILLTGGSLAEKPSGFKDGSLKVEDVDLENMIIGDASKYILGTLLFFPPEFQSKRRFFDLKAKDYYALGMSYVYIILQTRFRSLRLTSHQSDSCFEVSTGNCYLKLDIPIGKRMNMVAQTRPWLYENISMVLYLFKGRDEDRRFIASLIKGLICVDPRKRELILPDELLIDDLFS